MKIYSRSNVVSDRTSRSSTQAPTVSCTAFIICLGSSDEDVLAANDNPTQTVSLRSFWMDETEITNGEYRQFVEWVKDSTIKVRLAIMAEGSPNSADAKGKNITIEAPKLMISPPKSSMIGKIVKSNEILNQRRKSAGTAQIKRPSNVFENVQN